MANSVQLPETGFLRLYQIIGEAARQKPSKKPKKPRARSIAPPALIPVSRGTWFNGVASGRFPKPIKLGPRASAYRVEDIRELIKQFDEEGKK